MTYENATNPLEQIKLLSEELNHDQYKNEFWFRAPVSCCYVNSGSILLGSTNT